MLSISGNGWTTIDFLLPASRSAGVFDKIDLMDSWNYLHSLGKNVQSSYQTCPYCGDLLNILTKSFKVQFKTRKAPPEGAKELNLFYVTSQIFTKKYGICSRCCGKYGYDIHKLDDDLDILLEIPLSSMLLNDFVHKELLKYPQSTTCELLWRRTCYKRNW